MSSCSLAQFTLPMDVDTFLRSYWYDGAWYERFLSDHLEDLNVTVGEWSITPDGSNKVRQIHSYHPSKVSFPGLPTHAESLKTQTIIFTPASSSGNHISRLLIRETNTFRGIPYADYFSVNTEWVVKWNDDQQECSIEITLDFTFYKTTWLQGTIESNTKAELIGVYEKWLEVAKKLLKKTGRGNNFDESKASKGKGFVTFDEDRSLGNLISLVSDAALNSHLHDHNSNEDYPSEDEDMLFYDCEDGSSHEDRPLLPLTPASRGRTTLPVSKELKNILESKNATHGGSVPFQSSRDLAVDVVETLIVLAQFSYWKIYGLYMYDLKELFNVNPSEVLSRIFNSFFPGWHSLILYKPDLYGPLVAVFMLPQVSPQLIQTIIISFHSPCWCPWTRLDMAAASLRSWGMPSSSAFVCGGACRLYIDSSLSSSLQPSKSSTASQ